MIGINHRVAFAFFNYMLAQKSPGHVVDMQFGFLQPDHHHSVFGLKSTLRHRIEISEIGERIILADGDEYRFTVLWSITSALPMEAKLKPSLISRWTSWYMIQFPIVFLSMLFCRFYGSAKLNFNDGSWHPYLPKYDILIYRCMTLLIANYMTLLFTDYICATFYIVIGVVIFSNHWLGTVLYLFFWLNILFCLVYRQATTGVICWFICWCHSTLHDLLQYRAPH